MTTQPCAVVLAAGKGTRMKSDLPKVLLPVRGRPMLHYVLAALDRAGVRRKIVVVGYRAELVREAVDGWPGVEFALQAEQLGTGHAVMSARDLLASHKGAVVVVAGDSPMLRSETLCDLLAEFERHRPAALLGTIRKADPTGLGRIVRDPQGKFLGIVEHKDATPAERQIDEVNMSYYVFDARALLDSLSKLRADNAQREYYITDVPGLLLSAGKPVEALCVLRPEESLSINTVEELAEVERTMETLGCQ